MTLITVRAVVNVVADALMLLVCRRLSMTHGARKHRIVARIRMAIAADLGSSVCLREPRVIECCTRPTRRRVARGAGRWKSSCRVVRIRRVLVVGFVAPVAVCRQGGVVTVHVTVNTLPRRYGVRTRQRKSSGVVVESAVRPRHRVMAHLASCREPCLDVVHG